MRVANVLAAVLLCAFAFVSGSNPRARVDTPRATIAAVEAVAAPVTPLALLPVATPAAPRPPAPPDVVAVPVREAVRRTVSRFGARASPAQGDARFAALEEGHRLLEAHQTAEARVRYAEVVDRFPAFADGHYWLAYASAMDGDAPGACSSFERYLHIAPNGFYAEPAREQAAIFCRVPPSED